MALCCGVAAAASEARAVETRAVEARAEDSADPRQSDGSRTIHKRAAALAKLEKRYNRRLEACNRGETAACAEANQISGLIMALRVQR
ncbi:hypothetical protein [Novosphingobium sp.]|uniref:hypothetical protein n=1 Tax=Novosphingobium sp. TaxID=1874826 RepID=UPI003BAC9B8A